MTCLQFGNLVLLRTLILVLFYTFYCRIYKLSIITEDMGAFSAAVLSGLSASFHCFVRILFEYATNHYGQLLDIRK